MTNQDEFSKKTNLFKEIEERFKYLNTLTNNFNRKLGEDALNSLRNALECIDIQILEEMFSVTNLRIKDELLKKEKFEELKKLIIEINNTQGISMEAPHVKTGIIIMEELLPEIPLEDILEKIAISKSMLSKIIRNENEKKYLN